MTRSTSRRGRRRHRRRAGRDAGGPGPGRGEAATGTAAILAASLALTLAGGAVGCGGDGVESGDAGAGATGAPGPTVSVDEGTAGPNLLLITLDTLRADHLPSYGYPDVETPHLDRFVEEGVRFDQASSPVPITLPAHASILTGQYPPTHGVRHNGTFRLDDEAVTLAEILADRGYETGGFVGAFVLDARFGIAQGFQAYTDFSEEEAGAGPESLLNIQRRGDEVVDEFLPWLRRQQERFFAWVHLYDPHSPYEPPEPWAGRYAGRPYDGEIAYTDELVGRVRDALEASGHAENTLVVIAGDHGEGLGDHGEEWHIFLVYDSTVRVPLVLWAPGTLPGGIEVAGQASLVDLLPTILALLGVDDPAPASRDGEGLVPLIEDPDAPGRPAYSESLVPYLTFGWSELRALRTGRWKYIDAPEPELYDLREDPGETRDRYVAEPERAAEMRRRLRQIVGDDDPEEVAASQEATDAETLERLRALGYVAGGSVPSNRDVDPKGRIDVFENFNNGLDRVSRLLREERWGVAEEELRELDRLAPNHYMVHYYRGQVELAQGNPDGAVDVLEKALSLNPAYTPTFVELARAYRLSGDPERAAELLQEGIRSQPGVFSLRLSLGYLYHMERRFADALDAYRKAREMLPRHPKLLSNLANLYLLRGDPRAAQDSLEKLVQVAPEDASAWGNLGTVHGSMGNMAGAEEAFRNALEIDPSQARLHYNLGLVLLRQGRRDEAVEAFRRALDVDPGFTDARNQLQRLSRR